MNIFTNFLISFLIAGGAAAEPLRIGYPATGTIISAQIGQIFEKTGILKQNGFEASVTAMGTGKELKEAMVSGRLDVMMTSEANFVVLLGEGFDAQAMNTLGSAGRVALIVKDDSEFKRVEDLKGKTIATIFGTSMHKPAVEWAKEAGGSVININQMGALQAALETGATPAIISIDPFLYDRLQQNKIRILKEDTFTLITLVNGAFAKKNPQAIPRLRKAFVEAVRYMRAHRTEVNGWFSQMAKLEVKSIDKSSQHNKNYSAGPKDPVDLDVTPAFRKRLESLAGFLFQEKLIKSNPDISAHILNQK